MFSRHDLEKRKWIPLARALRDAPQASFRGALYSILAEDDRKAVAELAGADWPMPYLTLSIADGLERALSDPRLLNLPAETEKREVIERNAWFVDCDATAECFDDSNPLHLATRVDDVNARRARLGWLESGQRLLVGSEGGSALFADVIHFGHGPQTPYLGHLDAAFRDEQSPHFLGRHWPSDTPAVSFKPVPVPPALRSPYFDPRVRIPLYRAALGDEVIVSHHWSADSLKFSDVETVRALMEILYVVPPMYHLNRETWPPRRARILPHVAFWSSLHQQLATATLTRFEWLSEDRLVQRTTFETSSGPVTISANFSDRAQTGLPPLSATVGGALQFPKTVYSRSVTPFP